MRASPLFTLLAVLQGPLVVQLGAPARPEHLRYQRSVETVPAGSGVACAVLDPALLAHTASATHSDLRLFHTDPGEPAAAAAEVPYTLTESGPEPVADADVPADHVRVEGNTLSFDLPMPARPYAEVRLRLRLANFVATAVVEGRDALGGAHALGRVPVFDLTAQGLGRWTSMLLGESDWPSLHVELHVRQPDGSPWLNLRPEAIAGAEVPPSRLRQTRYVPAIRTTVLTQNDGLSVATLRVPAHVPVERVLFTFDPGVTTNFAREVTVTARADHAPVTDTEAVDAGLILHVLLPSGDPGLRPIELREDALDATLGATLAQPAMVAVAVDNHGLPPLPIRSVVLEMRERKLCFFADRVGSYTLRYGDPALQAPSYDDSGLTVPSAPLVAVLGAEERNPHWRPRQDSRPFLQRHPELFWLLVLLCGGMMGGSALHHVQHRRV